MKTFRRLMRSKKSSLFFCAVLCACIVLGGAEIAHATTWNNVFSDTFNRANGAVGNGWIGATSTASISSDELVLASGTNSPWTSDILLRPASEVKTDQQVSVTYVAGTNAPFYIAFRTQTPGTEYLAGFDGTYLAVRSSVGGNLGTAYDGALSPAYNSAHSYTITASATGTNPTTIYATMVDNNTSAQVAAIGFTDSTSTLQQDGQVGLFGYGTATLDNFNEYTTATSYTLTGPSSGFVGNQTSAFTVTPNGSYTGTITPKDYGAGGTFTPASLTFSGSATAQTFTYTPAASGTITIDASSSPALVDPAAVSLSVTSIPTYYWTNGFTDTFNRANGAVGNGWIGATSTASIVQTQLYLNSGTSSPWSNDDLLLPQVDATVNQRASFTFSGTSPVYLSLRTQTPGTEYVVGFDGTNLAIRNSVAGTLGSPINVAPSPAFNSSHTYQLQGSVAGSSSSIISATLTDLTTNTVVATNNVVDGTAGLQQNGEIGVFAYGSSTIDNFSVFSGSTTETVASSYALTGPSAGMLGQASGAFTVTPNGDYAGTVTPSDSGAGGTFTPASLTFSSSTLPQTFTYTPARTGTTTISVASSPAISNPSSVNIGVNTWLGVYSDTFNRANSPVGNGWIGATSTAAIISDTLYLYSGTASPWTNDILLRPSNEVTSDQRASFTYLGTNNNATYVSLRTQTPGTEYLVGINTPTFCTNNTTYCLYILTSTSGTLNTPLASIPFSSYISSHTYQLDTRAFGTNPTTIIASVTDVNNSAVVASTTVIDFTSGLQQNGQVGMFAYGTSTITSFNDYLSTSTTATSYTFTGPAVGVVNQASAAYTITPNASYAGTVTPSDSGAGGTFTPASLTFSGSSAAQTFTYTPATLGSTTISVTSSPAITNPPSITINAASSSPGFIAVNNGSLIWSPYNWHTNGSTWTETTPGGGYFKIAFTGSTLAIYVSTSTMSGVNLSGVDVDAYIDGTTTPIATTLGSLSSSSELTFTTSLSGGNHYAIVYLSKTPQVSDRWIGPAEVLRITGIQLANDGSGNILSLSTTPLARKSRKILLFGDSITEGVDVSAAERAYSAIIGQDLGAEYGQVGYGYLGWTHDGTGGTPYFYDTSATSSSLWRNYDANGSRLVNNANLSSGFIDGTPDAVFINLGINDADLDTGSTTMRLKVNLWLTDLRQTIGTSSAVFIISPFNFGSTTDALDVEYKAALVGGMNDYKTANPSDTRVYFLDLGTAAYNLVQANSSDGLHPDDYATGILGNELEALAAPYISVFSASPATSTANGQAIPVTLTGINTLWTAGTPGTPTFTISGGSGASIVSQSVTSTTTASLMVDVGNATGTLILTDPTDNATTTISLSAAVAGAAPSLATTAATLVSTSSLTMNLNISSIGSSSITQSGFAYGTSSTLTGPGVSTSSPNFTGTGSFSQQITGLVPNTAYYFRAYATNSNGTGFGSILSTTTTALTAPAAPTSVTAATSSPNQATISFTAPASNGGSPILYYFASSTPGNVTATSSGSPITVTGLNNGTAYTFQVYAVNAIGTSSASAASNSVTPTATIVAPTLSTLAASAVSTSSLTLNGSITATGGANATQSGFAYSTSSNLSPTIATTSLGAQTGTASFNQTLSGLQPNTTYYFEAYAANTAGTSSGSIVSTTTLAISSPGTTTASSAPTLTVQAATSIGQTGATLNGTQTADNNASSTIEGFNYGTTNSYGSNVSQSGSFSDGAFSDAVSSLSCGTTYYYQAYSTNSYGTGTSSGMTLTTSACPSAPTDVISYGGGGGGGGGYIYIAPAATATTTQATGTIPTLPDCPAYLVCVPDTAITNTTTTNSAANFTFTRDLTIGSTGADVKALQEYLNSAGYVVAAKGAGSPGDETSYFGALTQKALARFQAAHQIHPSVGYFGPITRAYISRQ